MAQVTAEIHVPVAPDFGGDWRFKADGDGTLATWKYTYSSKPVVLRPVAEPIGQWLLGKQIRKRIEAFGRRCADPVVFPAVRRSLEARRGTQGGALD